jgi:HlyD family secretion protein
MKLNKWHIIGLIVIIAAASVIYVYRNGRSTVTSGDSPRYKEFFVETGTFQTDVSASGVVGPIDRIEIKSKASGRIEELPVEEGDFVTKGSLICRLDQTDVQADVDQAQADLDIARAELKQAENTFNRRQQLYEKGLISEEERDQSGLSVAQAKGKMVRARTTLDRDSVRLSETIVRAPIGGIILQKYVEIGQIITSGISNVGGGTPIADIADMRFVYIEAGIDEIDVGKIRMGQEARVIAEAYPRLKFEGKIIRIAPEARIEQNVTLFDVVIQVENPESKLKSGMNTTVEITIAREENVLLAPTMALSMPGQGGMPSGGMGGHPGGGQHGGMSGSSGGHSPGGMGGHKGNMRQALVKDGDEFVLREVKIGLSNFRETVVISGLKDGDILGVPMISRLKAANERLEQRIKSTRSFGAGSNSSQSKGR